MSVLTQPGSNGVPGMRTFITIWMGQLVSILGSGLTSFALGVWIFSETGKATPFAMTVLLGTLPRLVFTPLAGSLADRWNRRWLMILADTGSAVVTLSVVILILTGELRIWNIYLIAVFNAVFASIQEPAYTSSISMLVPKKHYGRANGMIQMAESTSIILAPLLAGFLFGWIGLRGIILIDFFTFFFAVGALLIVHIPQPQPGDTGAKKPGMLQDVLFGWDYLRHRAGLFRLVWYFALINFLISLVTVLMTPLVLSFSSTSMLGMVQAISGVGMLAGSIIMSAWGGPQRKVFGVLGFIALAGFGLIIMGMQANILLITSGLFLIMISAPIASGCSQAIFQSKVERSVQGRVFAIRTTIARSITPLAFLTAGPLADIIFIPLLLPSGSLAATTIGHWIGVGPGRGIGLMFLISGFGLSITTLLAFINPHIRLVETQLPDALSDSQDTEPGLVN
jgi:MFS transporter, DHA3 family, macrolide efflux protein